MILFDFFKWYYYTAPMEIVTIWRNFLAFSVDFFGITYHIKTFFRPWHLLIVRFEEGSAIEKFFFNIAARIIGRLMGAIMRSGAILMGLLSFCAFFFIGIALELLWLGLPFLLAYYFLQGFYFVLP